jgi:hypothetical protein
MTNITNAPGADTPVPASKARFTADARRADSPQAEIRRNALRRFLKERQITVAELARRAHMPTPNSIYNHLHGGSASLSQPAIEKILRAFPDATLADITGIRGPGPADMPSAAAAAAAPASPATPFMVQMVAETGTTPTGRAATEPAMQVPVPSDTVPPGPDLFAIRVAAPGAEHLFALGSLLVCQRLRDDVEDLPDDTLVILRARSNGNTRVDVRQAEHFNGRLWLWPRSTHPDLQQPLPGPMPLTSPTRVSGGETITILGIVVASWQPEAPKDPI